MHDTPLDRTRVASRPTLLQTTCHLLRNRRRGLTLQTIAQECNCSVGFLSGLITIHGRRTLHPSVDKIQTLYEFLSESELQY